MGKIGEGYCLYLSAGPGGGVIVDGGFIVYYQGLYIFYILLHISSIHVISILFIFDHVLFYFYSMSIPFRAILFHSISIRFYSCLFYSILS